MGYISKFSRNMSIGVRLTKEHVGYLNKFNFIPKSTMMRICFLVGLVSIHNMFINECGKDVKQFFDALMYPKIWKAGGLGNFYYQAFNSTLFSDADREKLREELKYYKQKLKKKLKLKGGEK